MYCSSQTSLLLFFKPAYPRGGRQTILFSLIAASMRSVVLKLQQICKREATTKWNCGSMSERWKLDSCFVAQHRSPWIEAYVKPLDRNLLEVFDLLVRKASNHWFEGFDLLAF
jgi:hypothetical protein